MATPIHAKEFNATFNAVEICSASYSFDISADAAETTTSCDTAKTFLQGKYGFTSSASGPADFADDGGDETLFTNVIGGGAQSQTFLPDGGSAEGATNPKYTGNMFVTSYSLSADIGNAVQFSASLQGTGAITRDITP